jgi:hypothetical protein
MRVRVFVLLLAMFPVWPVVTTASAQGSEKKAAAFSLADVKYFHRFTTGDQHEFTPAGQEDLKAWKDMVTIHYYRFVKDGDALAGAANKILENYTAAKGIVVRTDSVPKTKDREAEHLIVVILSDPGFIEAVFARFRMHAGVGTAVIYSHRIYGKKSGDEMSAWLQKNGPGTEEVLMKWDAMPK